jgi:hypothetical protein
VSDLSDDEVDHLLSRGTLPREHKQRMLGHILASVQTSPARRPPSKWRWPAFAVLSLSTTVAVALLWARPSARTDSSLRDKGGGAEAPILAVACLEGSLGACPVGSRIAFWTEGGRKAPGSVTAYADPVAGGERIWYLTNEALPKAALVDKEQRPGRYRINVFMTQHPVARAELARLGPDVIVAHASFNLVVAP